MGGGERARLCRDTGLTLKLSPDAADVAALVWRLERGGADILPDPTALYGVKAPAGGWSFDDVTQRYRKPGSGRALPQAEIDKLLTQRQDALREKFKRHARDYNAGKINAAEFEIRMRKDIKSAHIQARLLGIGGRGRANESDFGAVGRRLSPEYRYLKQFAAELKDLSPAKIEQRAALYAGSAVRDQYTSGRLASHKGAGYSKKRRIGANDSQTCKTCREEIAAGWVDIDAKGYAIGHSECMANCRCSIDFKS